MGMKFTARRRKKMLEYLLKCDGNVSDACEQIGVSRVCFYDHCRKNPEFKKLAYEKIEEALETTNVELREKSKRLLNKSADILETQANENPDELDHRAVGIITRRMEESSGVIGTGASKITTETKSPDGTITKITLVGIGVPQISQVDGADIGSGEEDE